MIVYTDQAKLHPKPKNKGIQKNSRNKSTCTRRCSICICKMSLVDLVFAIIDPHINNLCSTKIFITEILHIVGHIHVNIGMLNKV